MKYLSLFSGVGGGDLAYQHLLGWQCIGYVEKDKYCQQIISQRIQDGVFDEAPIFGDINDFIQSGSAREYNGFANMVTASPPCQPFSQAGKGAGEHDSRNMWPATIETISIIQPRYAFLENVRGLVRTSYFGTILGDLADCGYDARWRILSAAEVGAPHKRDRLWIVAYANSANAQAARHAQGEQAQEWRGRSWDQSEETTWWEVESGICRVADGLDNRTNRLKAIGNGIAPQVAATAWNILLKDSLEKKSS